MSSPDQSPYQSLTTDELLNLIALREQKLAERQQQMEDMLQMVKEQEQELFRVR